MWNQQEMKEFMEEAALRGSVLGLENMQYLMAELGDIQDGLSVIHVAGTNGKGSVCAMTERILKLAGYRIGVYSSPAVFSYEEIFRVDGTPISQKRLREVFWEIAQAGRRVEGRGDGKPTLFELETAAAFLYFYQEKCDIVLLETGLGGRLDATNILKKPLLSVITSVGRDHMKVLGESLTEIAREKAGIIKEGCPVVSAPQQEEAARALAEACQSRNSPLRVVSGEDIRSGGDGTISYKGRKGLRLSLKGVFQEENAACVLEVIDFLREKGFLIGEEQLRQGLSTACWPGRFEVVCNSPLTVLDGAHNEDGAKKLRKTLEIGFTNHAIIYIIGVLADKEYEKILEIMLPLAEGVFTVTPDSPRALGGEELCRAAGRIHPHVISVATLKEAWLRAREMARVLEFAGGKPMILAFGSLSYLGNMKQIIGSDENDG